MLKIVNNKIFKIMSIQKIKIEICAILLLTILLSNCKNDSVVLKKEGVTSLKDYLEFVNTDADASVLLQAYDRDLDPNPPNYTVAVAIRGDKKPYPIFVGSERIDFRKRGQSEVDGKIIKTGDNVDTDKIAPAYGSTFSLMIKDESLGQKAGFIGIWSTSVAPKMIKSPYIPKTIKTDLSDFGADDALKSGKVIRWNKDPKNKRGVVITLEYDPDLQADESVKKEQPKSMSKWLTVPDTGSYEFKSNDVAPFPQNARISIDARRGGYHVYTDKKGKVYRLGGFTKCGASVTVKK